MKKKTLPTINPPPGQGIVTGYRHDGILGIVWESVIGHETIDVYVSGFVTIKSSDIDLFSSAVNVLEQFEEKNDAAKIEKSQRNEYRRTTS